jgi:hypothetical protein
MTMKWMIFAVAALLIAGGLYLSGAFGPSVTYCRERTWGTGRLTCYVCCDNVYRDYSSAANKRCAQECERP